nr:protein RRP6-like 2 [Tanacetum cinerariifolium]
MDPYAVTQQFVPGSSFGFYFNKSPQYVMNANAAYNYNNWCFSNNYGSVDRSVDLRNKENMFQLVNKEKNNVTEKDLVAGISSMRYEHGFGARKAKIPFHIASIKKPQIEYKMAVNNLNQPFYHALEKSEDGSRLSRCLTLRYASDYWDYTIFLFLSACIKSAKMERNSLEHLLLYFCGVIANKEYKTADCRLQLLTNEMLRYAREDTHYLLHIYDLMKKRLLSSSTDPNRPESLLIEVYKRSYDVCMKLYDKEIMDGNSYLNIYGLHAADLNGQQLAVVSGLCELRDIVARLNDESTGHLLPNKTLIEIAKTMPSTIGELFGVLKNRHPLIDHHLKSVINIIHEARANGNAFEEVAARLKRERLEMHQDAPKTSEETSSTSVGSSNVQQIKQPLNLTDSGGAEDGSQERNKGVNVANVLSSFQNGLKISNEVNMKKQTGGGTIGYSREWTILAPKVSPNVSLQIQLRLLSNIVIKINYLLTAFALLSLCFLIQSELSRFRRSDCEGVLDDIMAQARLWASGPLGFLDDEQQNGRGRKGATLSELYQTSRHILIKTKQDLHLLESTVNDSPDLATSIRTNLSHVQTLCKDMDSLYRSVGSKPQRDHWKRKVEQIEEEADSQREGLDTYFQRRQKRLQEAQERAELLNRANGESSHVMRIFDEEAQAMQSARNSSRMLEEATATGTAILAKYSEQRDRLK